jgi:hypothetical protein
MPLPFCEVYEMERKDAFRERLPIAQWPELERKMAIIARMTSDPPPATQQRNVQSILDETDTLSPFSDSPTEEDI